MTLDDQYPMVEMKHSPRDHGNFETDQCTNTNASNRTYSDLNQSGECDADTRMDCIHAPH
jgi:hypothetical protein